VESRASARRAIEEGRVEVPGNPFPKPATLVDEATAMSMASVTRLWASRAGLKLDSALESFHVEVSDRRCLDVGASTGGFTDVMLQRGARSVVALDVGYGQLDWRLRNDPRVTVRDRVNFRFADPVDLGAPFGLVTVDVSFISAAMLAAALASCGVPGTDYVVLVKPQFEVGREQVGKGGLVTDPALHFEALARVAAALDREGIGVTEVCAAAIKGATGNQEFFLHGRSTTTRTLADSAIASVVAL
jgi:23S rRNA (cytidine1920-2'-O)/16S rRNA (cytidine1409-2'-O)-methyltransferase